VNLKDWANHLAVGLQIGFRTARDIAKALAIQGIAAKVSASFGDYLCNYVFYLVAHYVAMEGKDTVYGFVHLPMQLASAERPNWPGPVLCPARDLIRAVRTIIDTSI
jgi:pyroglutamyl-peptidase